MEIPAPDFDDFEKPVIIIRTLPNPAPPVSSLTGNNIPRSLINHPCKICRDKFDTRLDLVNHMVVHDPNKQFQCSHCLKRFQTPHKLLKHGAEHFPHLAVCPICELKVESAEELELHDQAVHQLLVHDKPTCPKCLMCFDTNEEFQEHLPRHKYKVPKFECLPCEKGFRALKTLKHHLQSHRPETFKCSQCKAHFESRVEYRLHAKAHISVAPYKCSKCEAAFYQKNHLIMHSREMHRNQVKLNPGGAERPFSCFLCGDNFKTKGGLRMHYSSIHRQNYDYIADNLVGGVIQDKK
jgi:KRAB domain-containing zinc finger protein